MHLIGEFLSRVLQKKTALMYAAKLNSIAVINLLLQYKADLFATDSVSKFECRRRHNNNYYVF